MPLICWFMAISQSKIVPVREFWLFCQRTFINLFNRIMSNAQYAHLHKINIETACYFYLIAIQKKKMSVQHMKHPEVLYQTVMLIISLRSVILKIKMLDNNPFYFWQCTAILFYYMERRKWLCFSWSKYGRWRMSTVFNWNYVRWLFFRVDSIQMYSRDDYPVYLVWLFSYFRWIHQHFWLIYLNWCWLIGMDSFNSQHKWLMLTLLLLLFNFCPESCVCDFLALNLI